MWNSIADWFNFGILPLSLDQKRDKGKNADFEVIPNKWTKADILDWKKNESQSL